MTSQSRRWTSRGPPVLGSFAAMTFFVTFVPRVAMYRSSYSSTTKRRMRDVFPTIASPAMQTLSLRTSGRSSGGLTVPSPGPSRRRRPPRRAPRPGGPGVDPEGGVEDREGFVEVAVVGPQGGEGEQGVRVVRIAGEPLPDEDGRIGTDFRGHRAFLPSRGPGPEPPHPPPPSPGRGRPERDGLPRSSPLPPGEGPGARDAPPPSPIRGAGVKHSGTVVANTSSRVIVPGAAVPGTHGQRGRARRPRGTLPGGADRRWGPPARRAA